MTSPVEPMDPRLGRRPGSLVPENLSFGVRPLLGAVERKPTFWKVPTNFPLDQGREGACEAYGLGHDLGAGPVVVPGITNVWALDYYHKIQATDRAMGNFFPDGATTLANMKTAKAEGLITGYRWAFGLNDVVDTLCSVGPVCIGIDWFSSMYSTGSDGLVRVSGTVVGGHFICLVGYDVHPRFGPCVLWLNSWDGEYGIGDDRIGVRVGIGWVPLATLDLLLKRDGEAVVPADYFVAPEPPPIPQPLFTARRRSKVFHKLSCVLGPITDRLEYMSREEAVASGRRGCKVCRA